MQFAWQMKKLDSYISTKRSFLNRLIVIVYNVVWWVPMVLPFSKIIDYQMGFILFFLVTFIRATANLYRVNILKLELVENFPLRGPENLNK
jgi:hypothetical protein